MAHLHKAVSLFALILPLAFEMSPHSKTCVSAALSIEEKIVASGIRGFENKAIKVLDPAEASKPIRVVFEYRDEFKSSVKSINSDEDFQNHKKEMREHFMKENSARLQTIALEGFSKIIVSPYAPYIVLEYESLAAFISQNFLKLTLCDRQDLVRVYIESKKKTDAAIRNQSDGPAYSFHEALTDIGIPRNTLFDGTGIKIGSFENHIPPIDHPNFAGITIHRRGSSTSSHAASVASVFGGRAGIARGAELYFASDDALCFEDACTWFIDNDVHLVNQSCCYDGQFDYDSDSAYLDYVANQYKITFVNAVGNNNQVQSPSTGVNSLCVVSCDANNDVSAFSASGFGPSIQGKLYKPTFSAPGENIVGIPNISEPLDGTSFSAPMITGIAALLMQEFPTLKFYPAAVFSVLGSSVSMVNGQMTRWDSDAGFGRIHYQMAGEAANNVTYAVRNYPASVGSKLSEETVSIQPHSTIFACSTSLFRAQPSYTPDQFSFLEPSIELQANGVTYGSYQSYGNFSFLEFQNETPYTDFKIITRATKTKSNFEYDFHSLSWVLRP